MKAKILGYALRSPLSSVLLVAAQQRKRVLRIDSISVTSKSGVAVVSSQLSAMTSEEEA